MPSPFPRRCSLLTGGARHVCLHRAIHVCLRAYWQVWDNGYFVKLEGEHYSRPDKDVPAVVVGSPARFSKTPAQPRAIAPEEEGQDTAAVLSEVVGVGADEMKQLAGDGVIHLGGLHRVQNQMQMMAPGCRRI